MLTTSTVQFYPAQQKKFLSNLTSCSAWGCTYNLFLYKLRPKFCLRPGDAICTQSTPWLRHVLVTARYRNYSVLVLKHWSWLFSRPINWNLLATYAKC